MKVVFLGPCIAKKQEAIGDERVFGAVDAILTFEELADWFAEEGIDLHQCEEKPMGTLILRSTDSILSAEGDPVCDHRGRCRRIS